MKVYVKKVHELAEIPKYAYCDDAGCDVKACWVKETEDYVEYGTGLAFEIDPFESSDWFISGRARSSISKYDLILANGIGTIDNGYRNEVTFRFKKIKSVKKELKKVFENVLTIWNKDHTISERLINIFEYISTYDFEIFKIYEVGDKIGQLILERRPMIEFEEVNELNKTERNLGGYGHTGA